MPLDPKAKAFLDQAAAAGAPALDALPVPEARQAIRDLFAAIGEKEPVKQVEALVQVDRCLYAFIHQQAPCLFLSLFISMAEDGSSVIWTLTMRRAGHWQMPPVA
jgi:hypothetical protein